MLLFMLELELVLRERQHEILGARSLLMLPGVFHEDFILRSLSKSNRLAKAPYLKTMVALELSVNDIGIL